MADKLCIIWILKDTTRELCTKFHVNGKWFRVNFTWIFHVILREFEYSPFRFDTNANVLVYWSVIFQPNYSRPRRSRDFAFYFKFATWKWKKLRDFWVILRDFAWIWIHTLRYGKLIGHPWHFGTADWKKN